MKLFFANLFAVIYLFQNRIGNKNKPEFYTALSIGILLVMNLMFISYMVSFLQFDLTILFLRNYYVFTGILMVLLTILVLLYNKKYQSLLRIVNHQDKSVADKNKLTNIAYIILTILSYALAQYSLFDAIYFGEQ
jgi:hypothetical protein